MRQIALFFCLFLAALSAQAQSLALTFDDGLNPTTIPEAAQWNKALLDSLAAAHVKALLLPAAGRVDSTKGLKLVRDWGRAGHIVGNHSYSHTNLGADEVTVAAYTADILKAHEILRVVEGFQRIYRYPYLKEGTTLERRDAVRAWLSGQGYRTAPVSIDASDWYYSNRFLEWRAANPKSDLSMYRKAYLEHLWARAQYYDSLSKQLLGRSAAHVILLHTNAINAAFLSDVIAMFRSHGWQIVSPEQALADPLYSMRPTTLPAGESVLWSLAKEKGLPNLRYPAEDGEYEAPIVDAMEARSGS